MASPAFTGLDRYGPTAWSSGGDWASSRTLSAPSFSAGTCLVAIVFEYVNNNSLGNIDHWAVPSSWTYVGIGGAALSGGSNTAHAGVVVYQAAPGDIAGAVLRPEKSDNSLFIPSASAAFNFWRVFVTGWSPAKLASSTGTGGASETHTVVPYLPASPFVDGTGEGTWVQFTAGNVFSYGGGATSVNTANGFTQEFSIGTHPGFVVASKTFAATGDTDACIYKKTASGFNLAGTIVVALDTPECGGGIYRDGRVHLS